jgi:hypothetical protein
MHYRMIVKWIPFIGKTIIRTLLNVIKILQKIKDRAIKKR